VSHKAVSPLVYPPTLAPVLLWFKTTLNGPHLQGLILGPVPPRVDLALFFPPLSRRFGPSFLQGGSRVGNPNPPILHRSVGLLSESFRKTPASCPFVSSDPTQNNPLSPRNRVFLSYALFSFRRRKVTVTLPSPPLKGKRIFVTFFLEV